MQRDSFARTKMIMGLAQKLNLSKASLVNNLQQLPLIYKDFPPQRQCPGTLLWKAAGCREDL